MHVLTTLFRNSLFSIVTNIVNRLGNAVLFIFILQVLGVEQAGIYTLGISYFFIGSRFSFWGLDHLLTREVAQARDQAARFLSNFVFVRLVLSTAVIFVFVLIVQATSYQPETKRVIIFLLLSIWPENINNLCWAGFAAFEEFHFTTISVFFGSLFQIGLGLYLLWQGYGLVAMALVFFINNCVAMLVNLFILHKRYVKRWLRPQRKFIQKQLRVGLPFVFISVFFILDNRLDNIVLSFLSTEEAIGLYGAATAVIVALGMIPQGYRIAILPVMSRYRQENPVQLTTLYQQSYKYMLILGLPLALATVLLAEDLIRLLYRSDLPAAIPTLQIMSIGVGLVFLNVLNARLLIVYNRQDLIARYLVVTTVLNVFINLLLAPQWGAIGAGIARVVSIITLFVLYSWGTRAYVSHFTGWPLVWRPLVSTAVMGIVIWQIAAWGFWWQFVLGSLVYGVMLLVTGTLTAVERETAIRFLRQLFRRKSAKV